MPARLRTPRASCVGFRVSILLFGGSSLRCVYFSGVCGDCLASGCHGGGVGRARSRPHAFVSPEGELARRQLPAARGHCEPLGGRAAAFSSVLPRAVVMQRLSQRWGLEVSPAPRVRQSAAKPLRTAPGRAEPAISSSSAVPPLQTVPNNYSRFVLDAEAMPFARKNAELQAKPGQSWRVLRFFGPNTERSAFLGCCSKAATRPQAREAQR